MRTTLTIEDDALELARELSRRPGLSLGRAVSDLVRSGARRPLVTVERHGLQVAELVEDSPRVTADDVNRLLDDLP